MDKAQIFAEVGRKVITGDMTESEAKQRLIDAGWKPQAAQAHVERWLGNS